MKKINILKENRDFNRIINTQKYYKSKNYIIYIERDTNNIYNFGISVGKKIGNAVTRNKIKRQLKNIIDKNDYKNNFNCIIIVKKSILKQKFQDMEKELKEILINNSLIKEER